MLPLFAIWTAIGAILAVQTMATHPQTGDDADVSNYYQAWLTYSQMARAWLWALLTPLVFELRRRIPARGVWLPAGIVLHLAFCGALLAWVILVRSWIWALLPLPEPWSLPFMGHEQVFQRIAPRLLIDVALYFGTLGGGYIFDLYHERTEVMRREVELRAQLVVTELQREQLRAAVTQAELKALKQQLHPHFLFNALNAVAGLVRIGENTQAVEALARVSSLLRALIGSSGRPVVLLGEELGYCRTYLEIEKLRFDQRLHFSIDAAPETLAAEVPTLLLQPVVENAIKHGIARRRNPGWVRVEATLRDDRLVVVVSNDPAEGAAGTAAPESHGVGLTTTRERMLRTYGTDFRLDFEVRAPAATVVRFELPFQRRPLPPAPTP